MSAHPLPDAREARRLAEASQQLAEARVQWRIQRDIGGRFTTPEQRLAAAERLCAILDG